jgi:hypothetical protein
MVGHMKTPRDVHKTSRLQSGPIPAIFPAIAGVNHPGEKICCGFGQTV